MQLIVLLILLMAPATCFADTFTPNTPQVTLVIDISTSGVSAVEIKISRPTDFPNMIFFVALPFEIDNIFYDDNAIMGLKKALGWTIITMSFSPNQSTYAIKCSIKTDSSTEVLRVVQFGHGQSLIVPTKAKVPNALIDRAKSIGALLINDITSTSAKLPSGFSIIGKAEETKLYHTTTIGLNTDQRHNNFELLFNPSQTQSDQAIERLINSLLIVFFALLVAIMAPGVIPRKQLGKSFLIMFIAVLAILLIRFYITWKNTHNLIFFLPDLVSAIIYFIALAIVWKLQKRSRQDAHNSAAD